MATKPVEIEILLKDRLSGGLDAMQRKLDALMAGATNSAERVRILETAIGALNVRLAALKEAGEAANPDLDQRRNIAAIEQVETKIKELQTQLKALDETTQDTQTVPPDAGQAAKQLGGLHMSIQQMAREMPSLVMGPQMFFLAISNNLPIFADELARARKEYDALMASGKKGTPVWKQVLSSLFSWQTALVTGIMLLVMYGDEIVDWVKGLFTAKDALEDTRKAQEEFNAYVRKLNDDWRNSVATAAGENIAAYQRLTRAYNALGDNMNAKEKFIKDNQDAFHNLGFSVAGVADAENLFVGNTDAVVSALTARAKAAAYEQEITDATQRYIRQTEYNNSTIAGGGYYETVQAGRNWTTTGIVPEDLRELTEGEDYTTSSSQTAVSYTLTAAGAAKINARRIKEAADRLKKNNDEAKRQLEEVVRRATEGIRQQADAEQSVYDSLGLKPYERPAPKDGESGQSFDIASANEENLQRLEEYGQRVEEFNRDLQSRISSSAVDAMQEGLEKETGQIRQNRQSQLDELERSVDELAEARKRLERETWVSAAPGRTEAQYRQTEGGRKTLSDYRAEVLQGDTLQLYMQRRQQIIEDSNNEERRTVKEHYEEMLKEYGSYYERRNSIIEEYEKKRKSIEQVGGTAENIALLEEERDKELKSIDEEFAARQETYNRWAREITNLSVKQLEELLGELESRLAGIELGERLGVNGNADEAAQVRAKIESLKKSLKEAKLSPDKKDKSDWADLQRIIGECNEAFKEIGDTIGGVLGETVEVAGQLATGTMQAVSSFANMATAMENGDTAEAITSGIAGATSALQTAMQVYHYFSNVFGADYSEFEEMEAQYERLSDVWDELIAKKKEYIDESYGVESLQAYEEAVRLLERQQAYARQVAQARAAAGASVGSHSIAYRQNEWLSGYADELYQYIAQNGNWDDITNALLGASSEELALVRDKMPEFWAGLDADFRKALEDIIAADEQIEELGDDLKAAITGVSFDEFNSQFVDMLSDMDSTAKDFAENFSDNIRKSLMQSLVANQYKNQIEDLYDKWTEYAENGLTPEEVNELRAMYGDIVDALLAERDDINNAFGFSSGKGQQEASAGGFETMNHEQGTKLEGMFTSGLMHWASMDEQMQDVSAQMGTAVDHLRRIEENTGNSASHLGEIKEDIKKIIRDGLKMK